MDLSAVIPLILPVTVPADTTQSSVAPAGTVEMSAYFPCDEIQRRQTKQSLSTALWIIMAFWHEKRGRLDPEEASVCLSSFMWIIMRLLGLCFNHFNTINQMISFIVINNCRKFNAQIFLAQAKTVPRSLMPVCEINVSLESHEPLLHCLCFSFLSIHFLYSLFLLLFQGWHPELCPQGES